MAGNINTDKFREAFEELNAGRWASVAGAGDIVQVDGNTAAASYLDISKSPWNAGNETTLETVAAFRMPVRIAFGAHRSQATLGQEFSVEFVDTGAPMADVPDIAISAITQTASVLTIDTVQPHGLTVGKSIGVRDCSNQLANYPAIVVASIPSPNQIIAVAGPMGAIPSQAIANPAGAKGFIFFRERFGRSKNGVAQIFDNPTATNASLYVRSESGDALMSGTVGGNHSATVGSTASVQSVNAAFSYAFVPTTEYRVSVQADRTQWTDVAVDSLAQSSPRLIRTQVCVDPSETYKLRIRANNSKSLTVLTAKVVSVVKTGSTTGTFMTETPHGLVTGDLIAYYGNSNITAFPNLIAATAVTVINANTFTAVIGSALTVTGYGGVIAKVQGGNLPSALGANNNSAINVTLSTLADGTRQLVLNGSAAWAGLLIGDYVEVAGVTNVTNGATLGVDGAWKVANVVGAALTMVPATTAFAAALPANFILTNCGGAVVKRTCFRVSFVRVSAFDRERADNLALPTGDVSGAAPVAVQGGWVGISGSPTVAGSAPVDQPIGNPVVIGLRASTANIAAMSASGDNVAALGTMIGAAVAKPFALPEAGWNASVALNSVTAAALQTAAGAGLRRYITAFQAINTGAGPTDLILLDGVTERWRLTLPVNIPVSFELPTELVTTANTALNANLSAAVTSVRINAQGYTAP